MGVDGRVQELRIHGVGGSPGERMLGLVDPDRAMLTAEGVGTAFLARRADRSVEGYDWGGLTSSSGLQPLWLLLLPFTLVNVAGWMHPPARDASDGRPKAIVNTVHFLAGCMTASWVLYLSVVLIDLMGYQWPRRLAFHGTVQNLVWWDVTTSSGLRWLQVVGMLVGTAFVYLVMWAIRKIAGNTQKAFEARTPDDSALRGVEPEGKWAAGEDLFAPTFFAHPGAARRRLTGHAAIALLTFAAVAGMALGLALDGAESLRLGRLLLIVGGLEFAGIAALGALTFGTPIRMLPAATAALGFALTNAIFSGLILFVHDRISGWPALPEGAAPEGIKTGAELLLTDVWFGLIAAAILMTIAWVLWHRGRGSADGIPDRKSSPGHALDGAEPGWKQAIAKARGLAVAAETGPKLLAGIVALFFVVGLGFSIARFTTNGSWIPFEWNLTFVDIDRNGSWLPWEWDRTEVPDRKTGFWWRGGAWFLTLLPPATMALVYRATRQKTARRTVGILWDVLTFWPRRFHPFGVRPYSERAVVEFQARIRHHTATAPLVISAHSQGSILTFAALASAEDRVKERVALVTYGSPIDTLYGTAFPAYFGPAAVARLRGELLPAHPDLRWVNFYRDTDPIGGPVFQPVDGARDFFDRLVLDPSIAPDADDVPEVEPPVESTRFSWSNVAGHSHYLREDRLKTWVQSAKNALARDDP